MFSITSWVDVINIALTELGCNPIQSLSDVSKEGLAGIQNYEQARDVVLNMKMWKSASVRAELVQSTVSPVFGVSNAFYLPTNYVHMVMVHPEIRSHKVEGRMFLTNSARARIIYVASPSTPVYLNPLLNEAIGIYLARRIGYYLIQKDGVIKAMKDKWTEIYRLAKMADAFESSSLVWEAVELETARLASTSYNGVAQANSLANT